MTYDPTQPQNTPPPNTGVNSIKNNFSSFANIFDNNHVALNANNQGKHSNVILQQQGTDPTVDGSFDTLYGKSIVTKSATFEGLFAKIPQFLTIDKPNNSTQLTFNIVNTAGPSQYQSFLPGGYILYCGMETNNILNTPLN